MRKLPMLLAVLMVLGAGHAPAQPAQPAGPAQPAPNPQLEGWWARQQQREADARRRNGPSERTRERSSWSYERWEEQRWRRTGWRSYPW